MPILAAILAALLAAPARADDPPSGEPPAAPPGAPPGEAQEEAPAPAGKGFVAGRVVDDTGKPVAGAKVIASGPIFPFPSATSDAEGRFRIEGLDPDQAMVLLSAEGPPGVYGGQRSGMCAPGAIDVEIVLERAARVTGTVRRRSDGKPVAGVYVWRADSYSGWSDVRRGKVMYADRAGETSFARTDAEGRYALAGFPPGERRAIVAVAPDLAIDAVRLDVAPGSTSTADLALGSGAALSGRVLDADGAPLAGAVVLGDWPRDGSNGYAEDLEMLRDEAKRALADETDIVGPALTPSKLPTFLFRRAARTDEEGRFTFSRLPSGRRTLAVAAPEMLPSTLSVELADGGPPQVVEARLARAATVAGRAAFPDGKAASGGYLQLVRLDPGAPPGAELERLSCSIEGDGTFRIENVRPGDYVVQGSMQLADPGADPRDFAAPPLRDESVPPVLVRLEGGKTAEVVLGGTPAGASVDVHVRRRGAPARGVAVLMRLDGLPDVDFRTGTTDGEGKARLAGVPSGAYTLEAGPFTTRRVIVGAGEAALPVHVELPGGAIRGRVADAAGTAIVSATAVAILTQEGKDDDLSRPAALGRTDAEGRFSLEGLPPGRFEVVIGRHGFAAATTWTAVAAHADATVDAALAPEARIVVRLEGFSKGSGFMPLPPVVVALGGPGAEAYGARRDDPARAPGALLEAPAAHEVGQLPAGTYTVVAMTLGEEVARLDGVTASAGASVEVTLAASAPGTIDALIRDGSGKPVPGALVHVRLPDGAPAPIPPIIFRPPAFPADADGRHLRRDLPPGPYVVKARRGATPGKGADGGASGGEGEWASAPVTVKAGEVARVELTLP